VEKYAKAMTPLIHDAVQQHMSLAKGTEAEEFIKEVDYCFGYETERDFLLDHPVWDLRRSLGFKSEICQGSEFTKFDPFYKGLFDVVVRCKNHGKISDPGKYIKALSNHFIDQGGDLVISNVQDIQLQGQNSVRTIIDGDKITSDKVIIASGAWSKNLIKKFGIKIPLESERGYHIEFIRPQVFPKAPMMVTSKKFVITPMNGRIRAAGLVEFAGLKTGSRRGPIKLLRTQMKNLFPNLKYEEEIEWLGHRPALTDSLPMLGNIDKEKRLFLAFGHQHLGLTAGAKTGRIVSDLIMEKNINLNVLNYRPGRFTN
jgi:D-amino-acid dehydrogenase